MTKPWYESCANHALRFYFRHLDALPDEMPTPDFVIWRSCDEALEDCSSENYAILRAVYLQKDTSMQEIVSKTAALFDVSEKRIWTLLNKTARDFAKRRGLI